MCVLYEFTLIVIFSGVKLIDSWKKLGLNFRIPRNSFPPHLHVSVGFEDRGITQ